MKHQLKDGHRVENSTLEQANAIIALSDKLGISVYEGRRYKPLNNNWPHIGFNGSYITGYDIKNSNCIPFDEFIARMLGVFEPQHKEVKLNIGKTAIVRKDSVIVGCTTLESEDVNNIFKAWEEVRERS